MLINIGCGLFEHLVGISVALVRKTSVKNHPSTFFKMRKSAWQKSNMSLFGHGCVGGWLKINTRLRYNNTVLPWLKWRIESSQDQSMMWLM